MSDKMRWRYGDTNPVVAAVDADTAIECGDMLWLDGDNAKPASMLIDIAEPSEIPIDQIQALAAHQKGFADRFLGVAMQRSRSGDTDPMRVATTGVFEFDCPSGTFELGDLISPHKDNDKLLTNQTVAGMLESVNAIARVAKREPDATTTVLVDIRSTVMTGGIR